MLQPELDMNRSRLTGTLERIYNYTACARFKRTIVSMARIAVTVKRVARDFSVSCRQVSGEDLNGRFRRMAIAEFGSTDQSIDRLDSFVEG